MPSRSRKVSTALQPRAVALIDGEHYPPVVKAAIEEIEAGGTKIKSLGFLGGTEKISAISDLEAIYGRSVRVLGRSESSSASQQEDVLSGFREWLLESQATVLFDLSDEPVLDLSLRFELIEIARVLGVEYQLPDAIFRPQSALEQLSKPSLMIIGTGKRVGKTAISGHVTRLLKKMGRSPVIIATGRGGPGAPVVVPAGEQITSEVLLERSRSGSHAASDYFEDAFFTGATTIGSRRCGGGLFGLPFTSNIVEAAEAANRLDDDLVVVEGSGASVPHVSTDLTVLVIGAFQELCEIDNVFMRSRIRRADAVVITMCEAPFAGKRKISSISSLVSKLSPRTEIKEAVFRPKPAGSVRGRKVLLTTTAKPQANKEIKDHLEKKFGCSVIFISNKLSDRPRLIQDIKRHAGEAEILLCEIKAAGIDVVTEMGKEFGKQVVYVDNIPVDPATGKPISLNVLKKIKVIA